MTDELDLKELKRDKPKKPEPVMVLVRTGWTDIKKGDKDYE